MQSFLTFNSWHIGNHYAAATHSSVTLAIDLLTFQLNYHYRHKMIIICHSLYPEKIICTSEVTTMIYCDLLAERQFFFSVRLLRVDKKWNENLKMLVNRILLANYIVIERISLPLKYMFIVRQYSDGILCLNEKPNLQQSKELMCVIYIKRNFLCILCFKYSLVFCRVV